MISLMLLTDYLPMPRDRRFSLRIPILLVRKRYYWTRKFPRPAGRPRVVNPVKMGLELKIRGAFQVVPIMPDDPRQARTAAKRRHASNGPAKLND